MEIFKLQNFIAAVLFDSQFIACQEIAWTWVAGSQRADSGSSDLDPGGRSGAAYWEQPDEKAVWMFGGEYHVENSLPQLKNDLWRFDLLTTTWTIIHDGISNSTEEVPSPRQLAAGCGLQGTYFVIYGGLGADEKVLGDTWIYYFQHNQWYRLDDFKIKIGVKNSTDDKSPEPRGDMSVWCEREEMHVFGGFRDDSSLLGLHHDMWKLSLSTLLWSESKQSAKLPSDHDFIENLSYPAGRSGATTWVADDRLFMFAGNIKENNPRSKHLNMGNSGDLWEYKKTEDMWVFLGGSKSVCTSAAKYGSLGVPSPTIYPGCRRRAATWVDSQKNLWMFGGDGIDDQSSVSVFEHSKLLSDIWFYDLHSLRWTWKGGPKSGNQGGKFGDRGQSSKDFLPGPRCESVVFSVWNYFYLFGGIGHDVNKKDGYLDDIWKLDVSLDTAVKQNAPHPGQVFGIILLGLALTLMVFTLFCLSRKYFLTRQSLNKAEYKRIPLDVEQ